MGELTLKLSKGENTLTEQLAIPSRFPAEKSDKALFIRRRLVDLQLHHVITFSGYIDHSRMAKAIRLSLDAEPVLGCKYVEHWWQPYWQRREDLDLLDLCTLTETSNPDQAILDYLTIPLDPRKDPLIQTKIFRSESDSLCIKANHIITDGAGLAEYSHLLASIYRKLEADSNYRPEINLKGSRSINQVLTNFNVLSKLKMIRRGFRNWKNDTFPRSNWQFPAQKGVPAKKTIILRKIHPEQFQIAKSYAKANKVTFNHIMVTAFYRALYRIIQPKSDIPLRLGSMVNLRRYLPTPEGQAICNLTGFVQLNIGSGIEKDFDSTLDRVKMTYSRLIDDYLGLGINRFDIFRIRIIPFCIARQLFTVFSIINSWITPKEIAPWLSNIGAIDSELLNFGDQKITESYIAAPPTNSPVFAIAVNGFKSSITISIGFSEPNIEKSLVDRLLDYVEEELAALSTG